jgi:hypothetical protein
VSELRSRPDQDAAEFVRHFERLNTLAETRFERPLCSEELQELFALRSELRNRLAGWLEKR